MLRTCATLAALLSAVGAYKLPAIGTRVSHATPSTRASVRLDEDRCYYGKLDADGSARKVVKCSCVVVSDYGEESEGLTMLQEFLKKAPEA